MSNLPEIIPPFACPVTIKIQHKLKVGGNKPDKHTKLISAGALIASIAEIDQLLIPAELDIAKKLAKRLIGGYPKREVMDPKTFAESLVFDIVEYPPDIISRAIHEERRRNKFLPTCAELRSMCEKFLIERKVLQSMARAQLNEHKRREEARKRQEEREAVTPEQKARVSKLVDDLRISLKQPDWMREPAPARKDLVSGLPEGQI